VHQVFGFKDLAFQSLYHFTVGGPVDDPRLTTLPPYGRRVKARPRGVGSTLGQARTKPAQLRSKIFVVTSGAVLQCRRRISK
jgi:hypothetical protein